MMDLVTDFIVDNYFWFLLIGVVLLMAVIGYLAEKTNFGKKEFAKRVESDEKGETKKDKKKKKKKDDDEFDFDAIVPMEEAENKVVTQEAPKTSANDFSVSFQNEFSTPNTSNNSVSEKNVFMTNGMEESVDPSLYEPFGSNNQQVASEPEVQDELYAPLGSFEPRYQDPYYTEKVSIDEPMDNYRSFQTNDRVREYETSQTTSRRYQNIEHIDEQLPDLDRIKTNVMSNTEDDDDDVWKF